MDVAALSLAQGAAGAEAAGLRGDLLSHSRDGRDERVAAVLWLGGRRAAADAGRNRARGRAHLGRRLYRLAHPAAGVRAVARWRLRQGAVPRDARGLGED